jgi:hypothetical protein
MAIRDTPSPEDEVRALYEQAESRTARAFEEFVSKPSFGVLLARSAENVAALSRIGADFADLVLRNLRLAGRADVARLAQQLRRSEDKLERLLQEVEALRDAAPRPPPVRRRARRLSAGHAVMGPTRQGEPGSRRERHRGTRPRAGRDI